MMSVPKAGIRVFFDDVKCKVIGSAECPNRYRQKNSGCQIGAYGQQQYGRHASQHQEQAAFDPQ
jgi:hypothetical protein